MLVLLLCVASFAVFSLLEAGHETFFDLELLRRNGELPYCINRVPCPFSELTIIIKLQSSSVSPSAFPA